MLIYYGTNSGAKEISSGQFFCPHCQRSRRYKKYKLTKNFNLFFVDLFPIHNYGEIIECQGCFTPLEIDILSKQKPTCTSQIPKEEISRLWKDYYHEIGIDDIPEDIQGKWLSVCIIKFKEAGAYLEIEDYLNARKCFEIVLYACGEQFKASQFIMSGGGRFGGAARIERMYNDPKDQYTKQIIDNITIVTNFIKKFHQATRNILMRIP